MIIYNLLVYKYVKLLNGFFLMEFINLALRRLCLSLTVFVYLSHSLEYY